jgi:hypothetical protein
MVKSTSIKPSYGNSCPSAHSAVPVLIGTNILSSFIDQLQGTYGDKYLQDAHLFTSVYMALRCLTLRERNVRRQQNILAVIKSAEKKTILIQPNSEVVISGYMDRKLPYHPVCALIQPTKRSSIPVVCVSYVLSRLNILKPYKQK